MSAAPKPFSRYEEQQPATDIFSVLGEPDDPKSDWAEMRCTQLAGYDYIFISRRVNSKLANRTTLQEFILDIFQVMETTKDRAKIFIYSETIKGALPEFAAFDVTFYNGLIRDFHISPIKNLEQKEFIRTIFDHSGMLVGTA